MIELEETPTAWTVRASEADVATVTLGHGLRITMYVDGGAALDVLIETDFLLKSTGQESRMIDPQEASAAIGELAITLLNKRLAICEASIEGELLLVFQGGITINVAPNPKFEAWNLDAPLFKLIALPGGEIAQWDRNEPAVELSLKDV